MPFRAHVTGWVLLEAEAETVTGWKRLCEQVRAEPGKGMKQDGAGGATGSGGRLTQTPPAQQGPPEGGLCGAEVARPWYPSVLIHWPRATAEECDLAQKLGLKGPSVGA